MCKFDEIYYISVISKFFKLKKILDLNMALDEIKSELGGKWKLDRSENFDDFLKELGEHFFLVFK